jgi:hypothetical protein
VFPTIPGVTSRAAEHSHAVCFDFAWYFGHFEIAADARAFYVLKVWSEVEKNFLYFVPTTVPTGSRCTPLFCQILTTAIATAASSTFVSTAFITPLIEHDVMIDNFRFASSCPKILAHVSAAFLRICATLRVTVNHVDTPSKTFLTVTDEVKCAQEYTFLGIKFDHSKQTVTYGDKSRKHLEEAIKLVNDPDMTVTELQSVFGRCIFASIILAENRASRYPIYKYVRRRVNDKENATNPLRPANIWPSVKPALLEWITFLLESPPRKVVTTFAFTYTLVSDASDTGFGAILFRNDGGAEAVLAGAFSPLQKANHINYKEMLAIRLGLQLSGSDMFTHSQSQVAAIDFVIDSTTAIGVIKRSRSSSFILNGEARRINTWLHHHNLHLRNVSYITSTENPADYWSRIKWKSHRGLLRRMRITNQIGNSEAVLTTGLMGEQGCEQSAEGNPTVYGSFKKPSAHS